MSDTALNVVERMRRRVGDEKTFRLLADFIQHGGLAQTLKEHTSHMDWKPGKPKVVHWEVRTNQGACGSYLGHNARKASLRREVTCQRCKAVVNESGTED